jgi:purine catabolism regulator
MLTVASLVSDCGLELIAGDDGAERPIRWVHISELEDPTPWLSGGELLLTTGIQLNSAARQRRFLDRLADRDVAGIGLGTGFEHKNVPKAFADEASKRGIPLFEVPYEMPFIAITERAFARLVNEQYAVLERGAKVHEKLERLVVEGRGLDAVLTSLAGAIGGAAIVQDAGGRELARQPAKGGPRATAMKALGRSARARGAGPRAPGRLPDCVAHRRQPARATGRLRAAHGSPGSDRRGSRTDARAGREGDGAPACRRCARRGAWREARRR